MPTVWRRRLLAVGLAAALLGAGVGCGGEEPDGDTTNGGGGGGSAGGNDCKAKSDGNLGIELRAELEVVSQDKIVAHNGLVTLATSTLATGASLDTVFTLRNIWDAKSARELRIEKIELLYGAPDGATDAGVPFVCTVEVDGNESPCDGAKVVSLVPETAGADFCTSGVRANNTKIHVRFQKQADNVVRQAVLRLTAPADERYSTAPYLARLTTKAGTPKLKLSPEIIDFGVVKLGACSEKKLSLVNSGDAEVLIDKMEIAKTLPKPIKVQIDGKDFVGGDTATFSPPLAVAPQGTVTAVVSYCPVGPEPFLDVIKVYSNDASSPQNAKLSANQQVPCLKVIPQNAVNFGFVPLATVGTRKVRLESCGSSAVEVSALALAEDKGGVFQVDSSKLAGLNGKPVSKDNPLLIEQNKAVEVELRCTPEEENKDSNGKPSPYTAKLLLEDNTIAANKTLEISCWGTATNCPTAVGHCQEGEEIVPQTPVKLIGSQSFAGPSQKILKYQWKLIKQPKGSEVDHKFWPNANTADPKFGAKTLVKDFAGTEAEQIQINIAGEYVFELEVTDDAGHNSCQPAQFTVLVVPDDAIHVELLWDTPGDQDKLDQGLGAGADLDLHFTHSNAGLTKICQDPPEKCGAQPCYCLVDLDKDGKVDPYFHIQYDAFWYNASPDWGSTDKSIDDNPQLDLDDTDGWGPENLNLKIPENKVNYTVGVHYWDDHDFGDSVATVRIYIQGVLKGEYVSSTLAECDLWWVKQIAWPSGDLLDISGPAGKITPKYHPKFAKSLGAKCGG